ncbi:MAG: hypothetical protein K9H16_00630 [Bacteroidales bacterium]|nr:hypothetical protein [Bacteroidales bacterium]
MITLNDLLLGEISKNNTLKLAQMAIENHGILDELWSYAISEDEPVNWRSAWVLKGIWELNPDLISPLVGNMILALPGITKDGVKREFLRIIQEYPIPEDEIKLGILLDCCFSWLANTAESVAVKIHSMTILFEISKKIPEIKNEFIHTIEVSMQEGSAGIVNRGSKTIRALKTNRKTVN